MPVVCDVFRPPFARDLTMSVTRTDIFGCESQVMQAELRNATFKRSQLTAAAGSALSMTKYFSLRGNAE